MTSNLDLANLINEFAISPKETLNVQNFLASIGGIDKLFASLAVEDPILQTSVRGCVSKVCRDPTTIQNFSNGSFDSFLLFALTAPLNINVVEGILNEIHKMLILINSTKQTTLFSPFNFLAKHNLFFPILNKIKSDKSIISSSSCALIKSFVASEESMELLFAQSTIQFLSENKHSNQKEENKKNIQRDEEEEEVPSDENKDDSFASAEINFLRLMELLVDCACHSPFNMNLFQSSGVILPLVELFKSIDPLTQLNVIQILQKLMSKSSYMSIDSVNAILSDIINFTNSLLEKEKSQDKSARYSFNSRMLVSGVLEILESVANANADNNNWFFDLNYLKFSVSHFLFEISSSANVELHLRSQEEEQIQAQAIATTCAIASHPNMLFTFQQFQMEKNGSNGLSLVNPLFEICRLVSLRNNKTVLNLKFFAALQGITKMFQSHPTQSDLDPSFLQTKLLIVNQIEKADQRSFSNIIFSWCESVDEEIRLAAFKFIKAFANVKHFSHNKQWLDILSNSIGFFELLTNRKVETSTRLISSRFEALHQIFVNFNQILIKDKILYSMLSEYVNQGAFYVERVAHVKGPIDETS